MRCDLFRNEILFEYWTNGPRCIPKASGHTRKELFDIEQLSKRRKAEDKAVDKALAKDLVAPDAGAVFEIRSPTEEDKHECIELNADA